MLLANKWRRAGEEREKKKVIWATTTTKLARGIASAAITPYRKERIFLFCLAPQNPWRDPDDDDDDEETFGGRVMYTAVRENRAAQVVDIKEFSGRLFSGLTHHCTRGGRGLVSQGSFRQKQPRWEGRKKKTYPTTLDRMAGSQ